MARERDEKLYLADIKEAIERVQPFRWPELE